MVEEYQQKADLGDFKGSAIRWNAR